MIHDTIGKPQTVRMGIESSRLALYRDRNRLVLRVNW